PFAKCAGYGATFSRTSEQTVMNSYACEAPYSNDWFSAKHVGPQHEQLSVDQLLHLMNQINGSVKGGLFNAQLANHIFVLCQQLKFSGQLLEQTHKSKRLLFIVAHVSQPNEYIHGISELCSNV
uniref:K Homology domain-containing protein n=1 Tax=Parascaris univalens TaxID=6257 RepID=A0A915B2B4_PARUN